MRELKLPYVLIMISFAIYDGRSRESLAWGLGFVGFIIYFVYWGIMYAQLPAVGLLSALPSLMGLVRSARGRRAKYVCEDVT